ncbi:glycosyltransferase [Methylomonas sp. HW2-6]|uniref:glycosyltransferase n=1 Tax=Methylomonas sp. HW2-6 TaxID=3376687 RepID=UPI0040422B1D
MRLLFLSKRHPQHRDILTRPYGRFFYLPLYLSKFGHDATVFLLDYSNSHAISCRSDGINWYSFSARPMTSKNNGIFSYIKHVEESIQQQQPDWIIGFSDTWYGILAVYLGKRYGIKSLVDAYDNYESYIPWCKPLHKAWHRALANASAVTGAGPELVKLLNQHTETGFSAVIPMAADPIFKPIHASNLRALFGLPENEPLVGYCGSLYKNRGIEILEEFFIHLQKLAPTVKLVISGRRENSLRIPETIRDAVIELGYLPDEKIPLLINALDVMLVFNRDSEFGRFSYPIKLYEAMQCEKPVISSKVASTNWILRNHPECLVDNNEPISFANSVHQALQWNTKKYNPIYNWETSAKILEKLLLGN